MKIRLRSTYGRVARLRKLGEGRVRYSCRFCWRSRRKWFMAERMPMLDRGFRVGDEQIWDIYSGRFLRDIVQKLVVRVWDMRWL